MQSLNINQLVIDGLAPLSYASQHVIRRLLDIEDISTLSTVVSNFPQQKLIIDDASFANKNITALLRSALVSGVTAFRRVLHDFQMTHKRIFVQEINQHDRYQNTLLWYLTVAGLFDSIEELVRLSSDELNINTKNGLFNQTILHYAVIHANLEEIRIVLDIGVDTNLCDRYGRTPLHYVALYGTKDKNDVKIAKLLVDHGILLNLGDTFGQTSLHLAILKENDDLVEYLTSLASINVCIRNIQGYTPLCYLCEHILNMSDTLFENNQYADTLTHIFKTMLLIIDRCPSDQLSDNLHIVKHNKLRENLFLHMHKKLRDLTMPLYKDTLLNRVDESIIIGTDQDHRLFVEQLLNLSSWKSAIYGLCNTHNVDVSNALIRSIAHDPHVLLTNHLSPSSELANFFVLTFYSLATNVALLKTVVPLCKYIIEQSTVNDNGSCELYIDNYNLHVNYTTFIHTCLHYADSYVFSLKHLCRHSIRQHLKSHITDQIEKCAGLKLEHRQYLQLSELSVIYFQTYDLLSIVHLIERLYNIHPLVEYPASGNQINHNLEPLSETSSKNTDVSSTPSPADDIIQNVLDRKDTIEEEYQFKSEEMQPIRQRTIEEIMAESDVSFSDFNEDQPIESNYSSQPSMKTSLQDQNLTFEINPPSILSISDYDKSTEQLESELADVQTKTRDIEEMIDKFLSKT